MPLPEPAAGEARDAYLDRCMADPGMRAKFSDPGARFAVGVEEWERQRQARKNAAYAELARHFGIELAPRSLYVRRDLLNGNQFAEWAKAQGFATTLPPEELHATVCYSKGEVLWECFKPDPGPLVVPAGSPGRTVMPLGSEGAVVLRFAAPELEARHAEFGEGGATWDYPSYHPHVTITYQGGPVVAAAVAPFAGDLIFGPEVFEELDEDWSANPVEKQALRLIGGPIEITKVAPKLRLAYGWFSVIEKDGVPLVDSQGDVISPDELRQLVHGFNMGTRAAKIMHSGRRVGDVVALLDLTRDVQEAAGMVVDRAGAFGAMRVHEDQAWKRFETGELTGFSWGGFGTRKPRVAPDASAV